MRKDIISRELAYWRSQRPTRVTVALMLLCWVLGLLAVWSVQ